MLSRYTVERALRTTYQPLLAGARVSSISPVWLRPGSDNFAKPIQLRLEITVEAARSFHTYTAHQKHSHGGFRRRAYCTRDMLWARTFTTQSAIRSRANNNWQPGTEPGLDPNDNEEDCFKEDAHALHQDCTITVHDFSPSRLVSHDLNNDTLEPFLANNPRRPWWAEVRWINIDGISWDVIRVLGRAKGLHRLAIEDLMNKKNRSKVDWYPDAAFG